MGFRRLTFLLSVTCALSFAACGDNKVPVFEDAMSDGGGDDIDAPPDAPPDALECGTAPNLNCGGTCVNTNSDNNNCGACGEVCDTGAGESCTNGLCCGTGQTNCGGQCVNVSEDEANCGACSPANGGTGDVCDTTQGETCQNGTCCGGNNTACGNQCFDLQTDENHCGDCQTMCSGSTPECASGKCCPAGWINCNDTCVDPNSDEANCGGCAGTTGADVCTNTETCTEGLCCTTGQENCNGVCIDTNTNNANCGACAGDSGSDVCDTTAGESCSNGICCGSGTVSCNGTSCTNTQTDPNNCGGCAGSPGSDICTAGETCLSGSCCGPGEINCGGVCIDPLSDAANCGGCPGAGGVACPIGDVCTSGSCSGSCPAEETECPGGDCANTLTDNLNCGACGNECAANQVCNNGTCSSSCTLGMACSGDCVDVQTDENNCGMCGTNCGLGETCSSGICCGPGLVNTMGICCAAGSINCNGVCVDPTSDTACGACDNNCTALTPARECVPDESGSTGVMCCPPGQRNCNGTCVDTESSFGNCGACGASCDPGETCDGGLCCGSDQENCPTTGGGEACTNTAEDEQNCGMCGLDCASGEECSGGICCPTGQYNAGGICCNTDQRNCGGACFNVQTSTQNCGGCVGVDVGAMMCGTGQFCNGGTCSNQCTGTGNNTDCGFCTNPLTDENACGQPGVHTPQCDVCPAGGTCENGTCACPATNPVECDLLGGGSVCVDTGGVPTGTAGGNSANCGGCGMTWACAAGESCTDSVTPIAANGATASGTTATFTTTTTHGLIVGQTVFITGVTNTAYNGTYLVATVPSTTTFTVTLAAAPGGNSGNGTVGTGECCGPGTSACGGACVDYQTDENNCGGCGNTCGDGTTCINGSCECGFNQIKCGNACVTPSVDPTRCGGCLAGDVPAEETGGQTCDTDEFCISGGCASTCPAPLTACGSGTAGRGCRNLQTDSNNCGTCGNVCPTGQGCSGGQCVARLIPANNDFPERCAGGGPPIIVDDGQQQECTGNIGATSFRFALCTLVGLPTATGQTTLATGIGPLSRNMTTDAFDSTQGPYVANPVPGIYGGGIGTNASTSNTATTDIGGDFWVYGSLGMATKGEVFVDQRIYVRRSFDYSKNVRIFGLGLTGTAATANIVQSLTGLFPGDPAGTQTFTGAGGNTSMQVTGTLATAVACNNLPGSLTVSTDPAPIDQGCGLTSYPNPNAPPATLPGAFPMGPPCDTTADRVRVRQIVANAKLDNDNDLIVDALGNPAPLSYQALNNNANITRLDLPCGKYYFDTLQIGKTTTIVVHGRTAIFVGGAVRVSQNLNFDLDPGASLDIFVGGAVNVSNQVILGSPAYPRLTRLYIGSGGCAGTGTCSVDADCCSGICTAGTCAAGGGGNLSQAMSLSQGGHFNGLIWAGYGTFTHQSPLEMYGSIYANYFDSSGETTIHYDKGAVLTGDECPPPPQGQTCESCLQCGNQACVNNQCGQCTSDSQCCPPLHCDAGTCKL